MVTKHILENDFEESATLSLHTSRLRTNDRCAIYDKLIHILHEENLSRPEDIFCPYGEKYILLEFQISLWNMSLLVEYYVCIINIDMILI